ncbi:hypothetical protein CDAR_295261 [Caerostris darwini]|uniref:Mos1 transposase HTH domain-containing protein n=1 Tax=Caerostris darwini TaxID=1538125 RepID=A0AAV4UMM3_9ARAC|nr:hypothetical protein CDAR_295261 [Caerostris darwini]
MRRYSKDGTAGIFGKNGINAATQKNKKCPVYGEGAVAEITVRKCFARFRVGDFNKEYKELPDRISPTVRLKY